jgi:surface protein
MNSQRITRSSASNQNMQLTPMQENIGRRRQREQTEEPNERALPKPKIEKKKKTSTNQSAFKVTDQSIRDSIKKYFQEPGTLPPIGEWDVSEVTNMKDLFRPDYNKVMLKINIYDFNEDISNWDVSNVKNMSQMFLNSSFNQDISKWNVSKVTNMNNMFGYNKQFNQPLNNWNVSNVKSMKEMFQVASKFNQPLENWDVSNVETMNNMFRSAIRFNQSLNNWNVSNVTDIGEMFRSALLFDQSLNNWNVSNVENMRGTFSAAILFNQPLNNWDVSRVRDFIETFKDATSFNQPLTNWNIRRAADMRSMFAGTRSFDQNLSNWEINTAITNVQSMFSGSIIREGFKPRMFGQRPMVAQPAQEGVAYQVHNAFSSINFDELFKLINSGKIDKYASSQNFKQYMKNELKTILDNYNDSDKKSLVSKFNQLTSKIDAIDYNLTDFHLRPNPSGENVFYTIINFIKRQEKHYQDNYIKFFINDSYSAYDTGDTTSCVKGIKERIIFALGQAGYDIDNPLYKQISEILFPLKDSQIYSFIGSCIDDNNSELIKISDENIEDKKNIVKECVKKQISESFPTLPVTTMDVRISKLINDSSDMLLNSSLSGGKRKRRTKKNNKRTKKYTKKLRRKHKNLSRKR